MENLLKSIVTLLISQALIISRWYRAAKFKVTFNIYKILRHKFIINWTLEMKRVKNRLIDKVYLRRPKSNLERYYNSSIYKCYTRELKQCEASDRTKDWKFKRCNLICDPTAENRLFPFGSRYCIVHKYLHEITYHAYHVVNERRFPIHNIHIAAEVELNARLEFVHRFNIWSNEGHEKRLIKLRLLKLQ